MRIVFIAKNKMILAQRYNKKKVSKHTLPFIFR